MKKFFVLTTVLLVCLAGRFAAAQDYAIGEGDVLRITIYDHEDLTQMVRVTSNGTVRLSLLGQVPVGGMPVSEAAEKIAALYADGYLVNPQVNVFIQEFRSGKATILGQIVQPGLYELQSQVTLLELISTAGGLTDNAGRTATIKRKAAATGGEEEIITIDLKELVEKGDTRLNVQIQPGDSIYIQKANMVYVSGEVERPGVYKCYDDTSVIMAITMAGGFTDKASPSRVKLIRKTDDQEEVLEKVNMDLPVASDDIIVVPESFF